MFNKLKEVIEVEFDNLNNKLSDTQRLDLANFLREYLRLDASLKDAFSVINDKAEKDLDATTINRIKLFCMTINLQLEKEEIQRIEKEFLNLFGVTIDSANNPWVYITLIEL